MDSGLCRCFFMYDDELRSTLSAQEGHCDKAAVGKARPVRLAIFLDSAHLGLPPSVCVQVSPLLVIARSEWLSSRRVLGGPKLRRDFGRRVCTRSR